MIRLMTPPDIAGAMKLKKAAGWNQIAEDWARVLLLEPQGCFVDERDGTVAGTTTVVRYGSELAWVGMVLVAPEYRRQGIARGLMQHAVAGLLASGAHCIKLDATDMARPLYRQLGFVDECPIERWMRPVGKESRSPTAAVQKIAHKRLDEYKELDRLAFGAERGALLAALTASDRGVGFSNEGGYLLGRPGSEACFLGPCAASVEDSARDLVCAFLEGRPNEPVLWDLLPANVSASRLAWSFGFRPRRRLTRMVLEDGGASFGAARPEYVYAAAGFEFG